MPAIYRHYCIIAGAICGALFVVSHTQGQDCHCGNSGPALTDFDPSRPDLTEPWTRTALGACQSANNLAACSGPFCDFSCRSEGVFFSAEIFFVNVWQQDHADIAARLLQIQSPAAPDIGDVDPDVDPTGSFSLGYQTCDGLGVQARFWEYETTAAMTLVQAAPADPNLVTHAWDINVFDLEVLMSTVVYQWDVTLSGGYRLADYEEGAAVRRDNIQLTSVRTRYFGNGLTGSINLRRQLTNRLSVMANPRVSLLFGPQSVQPMDIVNDPLNETFDTRYTLESKVGASYEYPICGGGYWFARGGYEVQYWNDFVVPIGSQTNPTSTLLAGFFFAVGLQR